jgi:hypothetical protein
MEIDEGTRSMEPAGVMAMACRHRRPDATREAPAVIAGMVNRQLVRARPGRMGWRRGSYYQGSLFVHRCMSVHLAPFGDRREAPAEPLAHRSHNQACVFSESRMREICLSGSMSGNRKQNQAKPD